MPKLVQKCGYICNGSAAKYMRYIATREGVEKLHGRGPVTQPQKELIERLLKDYPDTKELFEYSDYCASPTFGNASELITMALDANVHTMEAGDGYLKYIATRPRVEKRGDHGLFSDTQDVSLQDMMAEVAEHHGPVWTVILSLRREDASALGYDSAENWRTLLLQHRTRLAQAMKIPVDDFRWCAAVSYTHLYRAYIEDMQASFALLDERIAEINSMTEDGESLDAIRVKAFFYALYFGAESPSSRAHQQFVDCFVTYEERTRPLDSTDSEDESAGEPEEETYTVAIPITDIATIWSNIQTALGETVTEEQRNNVDSIYNLVRYGSATGTEGWIPGAEVPFIGADGFCSPVGSSWESRVTSEFGYRSDPFTGQTKGHTGIDIAVPTGTPVRAALPGVVTKATYNAGGYGYYVMIDHGNGMVTLYAHNSKLLVSVGDTVEAGDTVSLSGSTGRSTGPHLHFEVRVNGQRVNPRSYLPTN